MTSPAKLPRDMPVSGQVRISERAVTRIVAAAVASVPGTTSLSRSLERPAARSYPRYDVLVDDAAGATSIEAFIAVTWPSPVTNVAETARATIIAWVELMTGLQVTRVNVVVGPVVAGGRGRRVTQRHLDDHPRLPQLRKPVALPLKVTQPKLDAVPVTPRSTRVPEPVPLVPITVPAPRPLTPVTVTRLPGTQGSPQPSPSHRPVTADRGR